MDAEFLVRLVWFIIGLGLGYSIGTARTAMRYADDMRREIHACAVMLHKQEEKKP